VQANELVDVKGVMLDTVAAPPLSVTVPKTVRGSDSTVFAHVDVVPQLTIFVGVVPESISLPFASVMRVLFCVKDPDPRMTLVAVDP